MMHNQVYSGTVLVEECSIATIQPQAKTYKPAALVLEDGSVFEGSSFGYDGPVAGEVVFCTGMVGYPEALTDASFAGQILVMTYPLVGSYGVPDRAQWEDDKIHVAGLLVSNYIDTPSHAQSQMDLRTWLQRERVPALELDDTRKLTQYIRKHGTVLGKIIFDQDIPFYDPDTENQVARVSVDEVVQQGDGDTTIALIDCGAKRNIIRSLLSRGVRVVTIPWDYDLFAPENEIAFDGILISNGPGDPTPPGQQFAPFKRLCSARSLRWVSVWVTSCWPWLLVARLTN